MTTRPPIALLTDFGLRDPYVGIMKGVLLSLCPGVTFLDLTHELDPGDIGAAAFWIERCRAWLPPETVVLCVVDPTVGTRRRALCARIDGRFFVGPDNGVFSDLIAAAERRAESVELIEIDPEVLGPLPAPARGQTFHGRDVFAPAAARIAAGRRPVELGWPIGIDGVARPRFRLDLCHSIRIAGGEAQVRVADHFGNLITDFLWASNDDPGVILSGTRLPWVRTYAEAQPGRLVALRGSFDTVEIAMQGQSALKHLTL